jgi:hypothetical protein
MRTALLAALAVATLATAAEARTSFGQPAPLRQAGYLTCTMDPALGLVVGSTRGAACSFTSNRGGFAQAYQGRMDRVGIDLGLASGQTMTWRVYTPGGASRSNMLSGQFVGSSAEATFVVGPGTHILVNNAGERVALEPVGGSGQAGFSFAIGTAGLDLRPASFAMLR